MKNILIHGLSQNADAYKKVEKFLKENNVKVESPNLYALLKEDVNYQALFSRFADYCNSFDDKLNLCGLSLGGILALDYVKKYPEKVNSLILIGTPYKIPKFLFKIQGIIFHLMSKTTFEKIGLPKKDFIALTNSMGNLDIACNLDKIKTKTLILCGKLDKQNIKSAEELNKHIKNSTFKTIDNSSHEVNVDNPRDLANIIIDFWN